MKKHNVIKIIAIILIVMLLVSTTAIVAIGAYRMNSAPQDSDAFSEYVLPEPDRSNIYRGGSIELMDPDGYIVSPISPGLNPKENNPDCNQSLIDTDHALHAKTDYRLRYEFPDRLKAKIENGDTHFFVKLCYSFQVARGNNFQLCLEIHNLDSHEIYTYSASIPAADDLCLKHAISTRFYPMPDFDKDALKISLSTSAHPDAGPKSTQEEYLNTFKCKFFLKGIEDWNEIEHEMLTSTARPVQNPN